MVSEAVMFMSSGAVSSRVGIAAVLWLAISVTAIAGSVQIASNPAAKATIERGRGMFEQYCAVCHGKGGTGDGPAASAMTTKPTDLTLMQQRNGVFFAAQIESAVRGTDPVVAHGVPGMMVWGAIFRADAHGNEAAADARIRDLVAFIETIQKK
jgi:mono/diheme cytochrome c family protein